MEQEAAECACHPGVGVRGARGGGVRLPGAPSWSALPGAAFLERPSWSGLPGAAFLERPSWSGLPGAASPERASLEPAPMEQEAAECACHPGIGVRGAEAAECAIPGAGLPGAGVRGARGGGARVPGASDLGAGRPWSEWPRSAGWVGQLLAAVRSFANSAARASSWKWAFRPLGLGRTHTDTPPTVCSWGPIVAVRRAKAVR
jgi:hypothetical protein